MDRIECSVCSNQKVQYTNFFVECLYIVPNQVFNGYIQSHQVPLCELHIDSILSLPHNTQITKFNRHQLRDSCKFMGVKVNDSVKVTKEIFNHLAEMIRSKTKVKEPQKNKPHPGITVTVSATAFTQCIQKIFETNQYGGVQHLLDFRIASNIVSKKQNVIVLLGGASGTGKSSLSSLLASRLGISSMLSTDSIRHILRNFIPREEKPVLFCSTYEAGNFIDSKGLTEKQACIQGYLKQCELVYEYLEGVIENTDICRESIVIEGVHLSVEVIRKLMKKFKSCIPFVVIMKDKKKHMERFAVRSKYMTLDPHQNKYVANFSNIREIQKRFISKSDQCLIPKIDNSNLDRSLGLCHATIIRCLRQVHRGHSMYNQTRKQAQMVNQEFNFVAGNIWSSDNAQKLIKSKVSKGELFKRFFRNNSDDFYVPVNQHQEGQSGSQIPEIGSIVSGSVEMNLQATQRQFQPQSVRSISEDELSENSSHSEYPSQSNSNESDVSVHEEEAKVENTEKTNGKTHQRKSSA